VSGSGAAVASEVRALARRLLPRRLLGLLRGVRTRAGVRGYRAREVTHTYGGFPLRLWLGDGLAEGWYDRDWPRLPEVDLLRTGALRDGARVFNVGAHQAVVALVMARTVGPGGRVIAVEASEHNARAARRNAALNGAANLTIVHAAGAATPGRLVFNQGLNGQVDDGSGAWGRVAVRATTVDELAATHGAPDVLFLDVEGFEVRVLAGAGRTLAARPDCYVEVHVASGLEKFGHAVADLRRFFPEEDYRLFVRGDDAEDFAESAWADIVARFVRFHLVALARRHRPAAG
jgi:FkbM family methyltransferase